MHEAEAAKVPTIQRRLLQGFLPLHGRGLDVGFGPPNAPPSWRWWEKVEGMGDAKVTTWDLAQGDAHNLPGVERYSFDWIFASHLLEHLADPERAIIRWAEVLGSGGRMLLSVPHRGLYEKRGAMPSRWSHEHVRMYLPWQDAPGAIGFYRFLARTADLRILNFATGDWGTTNTHETGVHADGEYCIDALVEVR